MLSSIFPAGLYVNIKTSFDSAQYCIVYGAILVWFLAFICHVARSSLKSSSLLSILTAIPGFVFRLLRLCIGDRYAWLSMLGLLLASTLTIWPSTRPTSSPRSTTSPSTKSSSSSSSISSSNAPPVSTTSFLSTSSSTATPSVLASEGFLSGTITSRHTEMIHVVPMHSSLPLSVAHVAPSIIHQLDSIIQVGLECPLTHTRETLAMLLGIGEEIVSAIKISIPEASSQTDPFGETCFQFYHLLEIDLRMQQTWPASFCVLHQAEYMRCFYEANNLRDFLRSLLEHCTQVRESRASGENIDLHLPFDIAHDVSLLDWINIRDDDLETISNALVDALLNLRTILEDLSQ